MEAGSKFSCAALQCHLGGPMSSGKGPRTKKACKFHGMVQNKPLEDSVRSIAERAVETERNSVCAALQCHLGGPLTGDKGPRTMNACRLHDRVQDKSLNLLRSVVQGAVKAGS